MVVVDGKESHGGNGSLDGDEWFLYGLKRV